MSSQNASDDSTSLGNMRIWFQRVFNEITVVETACSKKEGFWAFQRHVYSEEELLSSKEMETIQTMISNIENLFEKWLDNGQISDDHRKIYWEDRLRVERRLGELRARIVERQPTFWEDIAATLTRLMGWVMKHLPMLPAYILQRIGVTMSGHQARLGRILDVNSDEL